MAANKRTKHQRENDLRRVSELYLQGLKQAEIAEQLGVSRQQITYDLRILQRRWQQSSLVNLNEKKALELAKIDHLEQRYWQAWEDSRKSRETTTSTTERTSAADTVGQAAPLRQKAAMRKEARDGTPAFLEGIQWCINKRCAILGLEAPKKNVLSAEQGQPPFKAYVAFNPDEVV
jgi:transcriptional regulator with XRE-family HTH domain